MPKVESQYRVPGSDFATGRPATGRAHALTVRISQEAADILSGVGNKSAFIDQLIKQQHHETLDR